MFGIPSFGKLVVLIGIVVAIWYGFKFIGRLDQARKQQGGGTPRRQDGGRSPKIEDTVQCPVCEAYVVAKSAGPCDRPDCPY